MSFTTKNVGRQSANIYYKTHGIFLVPLRKSRERGEKVAGMFDSTAQKTKVEENRIQSGKNVSYLIQDGKKNFIKLDWMWMNLMEL